MTAVRDAILRGTQVAADLHDAFRIRDKAAQGRGVDVFGVLDELGIPVQFAELDGLYGACVRVSTSSVGVLVTTKSDLHLQRFTAAHELGHFVLEHEGSLDREIPRFPDQTQNRDPQEIEADAFAAEFLMPKWLYTAVAKKHGWWAQDSLQSPDVIYQMSLRMAVSYKATCWGLAAQDLVPRSTIHKLATERNQPKRCKLRALNGTPLENPHADVWLLGAPDHDAAIEAGPGDLLVVCVDESAASGFLWDVAAAESSGFTVLADYRTPVDEATIGGPTRRRIIFKVPPPGIHELTIVQSRPWTRRREVLGSLSVTVSTFGRRTGGLVDRARTTASAHH